ncbi:MAG: hypothetical protein LBR19_00305, partial [Bifidobacteriaceae bacterium]|nr:hypothetical protein [Bifidobacteriaceae bacterium]
MSPVTTRLVKGAVATAAAAAVILGGGQLPALARGALTGAAAAAQSPAAASGAAAPQGVGATHAATPLAAGTITVSRQPVAKSVYTKAATIRLSVQAEATDGSAVTYQWQYSTSLDLSNPQEADPNGDADTKAVLTTTGPATAGTYDYWAALTASDGQATATSNVVQVVVVDKTLPTTLQNGTFEEFVSTSTGQSVKAPLGYANGTWDGAGTSNGTVTVNGNYSGGTLNGKSIFIERQESFLSNQTNALTSAWFHPVANVVGWETTHDSKYKDSVFTTDLYGLIPGSIVQISPEYNYLHDEERGYGGWSPEHHFVAELAADKNSSLYQEIATVPGKVYEWSLDHASTVWGAATNTDNVMAVVIGPAINSQADYNGATDYWNKAGASAGPSNGGAFPYGVNTYTPFNEMVTGLADQLATDSDPTNNLAELGNNHSGEALTASFNGNKYYVYVSLDQWNDYDWTHRTGAYSVPPGQGTTVFAFVTVVAKAGSSGNALDNIVFASGSAPDGDQEVSYEGQSAVKNVITKAGWAYALAEVRGSTVYPLSERDVWFTADGAGGAAAASVDTTVGDGASWYVPGAGELEFKNLVPGKTYRLIGLPVDAISAALGTNSSPADVFDDGYYTDITVKAGKDDVGSDGIGPNLSAALYTAGSDADSNPIYKGKIILGVTDSRS